MSPRPERSPAVVFFGWLLMAIGGLIAVTAGACTAVFAVPAFQSGLQYPEGLPGTLLMLFVFGGIPLLFGIALFIAGRAIVGRPRVRLRPPFPVENPDDQP